ncbi:MAG: DUF3619 family protein [Ferrovum sp.]|jgi:hypothetical protein|nr:DUF3619 family protein [Ferrovum sp.]NDU87232.1 DUF3619 family protein [Ferrovum sp.]
MNEEEFGRLVGQKLNDAAQDMDLAVVARLHSVRHFALKHHQTAQRESRLVLISGRGSFHWDFLDAGRWSLATVLFVFTLVFYGFWWQSQHQDGDEDSGFLDAKLLAAEIPPQDFAQKDFGEWLQERR